MNNQTVLVVGKNGQLASELNANFGSSVVCLGREELDVFSQSSIEQAIEKHSATALVNASAYTAVDKAETDKDAAFALNCDAVSEMAKACQQHNIPMVHVSTDYVFRGDKGAPYATNEPRDPQGVYGASKAAGEEALLQILPDTSCVIRTSWVYSCSGNNFVKTMLKLMASKPELTIIDDQVGSPTWARGLAQACFEAATTPIQGIFHWSDEGVTSWYDFAIAIQQLGLEKGLLHSECLIKPIPTRDYPTPATRPHYSVLDKTHTRDTFKQASLINWRRQLSTMLDQLATAN